VSRPHEFDEAVTRLSGAKGQLSTEGELNRSEEFRQCQTQTKGEQA